MARHVSEAVIPPTGPVTLRELRSTLRLKQREIARRLQKGQEEISRIESRADLRLSTLQRYVRIPVDRDRSFRIGVTTDSDFA